MNLVEKAKTFATTEHKRIDHQRKYTNQPYTSHQAAAIISSSSVIVATVLATAARWEV